jgi:CRISPR-associated endonuclease Csn1
MRSVKPNELRNPVVEQVLNQVANVVNGLVDEFGKPSEVRLELARELKSNAKKRSRITKLNRELESRNKQIKDNLLQEHQFKRVNGRDLLRYRLWDETERMCLYSGKPIPLADLYNGATEIEHILPKSRSFSNSMSNLIVAYQSENKAKDQMTAYEYMRSKGDKALEIFVSKVNELHQSKKITKAKKDNLLSRGEDIPKDFLDRQKNDTQYIAKEAVSRLKEVFPKVHTTTGSVTDFLREKWELSHVMKEVNLEKYRALGLTEKQTIKDSKGNDKEIEVITDWSKRDDHRHHAVDALIVALTNQSIIQRLNNLNQDYERYKDLKESPLNFPEPIPNLRAKAREELENMLISFKKPNGKVLSKKVNKIKTKQGLKEQVTWVPRGALHEDTIMGKIKRYEKVPLNKKFDRVEDVVSEGLKQVLKTRLEQFNNDPSLAFSNLDRNPILYGGIKVENVVVWDYSFAKRIALSENLTSAQVEKIMDTKVKQLVQDRIAEAGSIKAAFKQYSENPIYLDAARKIPVWRISVFDEGSLQKVRDGYVYLKGNHHAIIYTDGNGNFRDRVVSFWEAVEHAIHNLRTTGSVYPLMDTSPDENGWQVYTTLQINDLFVIGLDPTEVDFFNPVNRKLIAKHTYRVQKLSKGDYNFRHQYETTLERKTDFAFKRIQTLKYFKGIHKVRISGTGNIISVDE